MSKFSQVAIIREAECIGCAKCIPACPVDAILGSAKHMHTVISRECIACQLCIPACPVDCIDMVNLAEPREDQDRIAAQARERFKARKQRLAAEVFVVCEDDSELRRKAYIQAAIDRVRMKKG